MKRLAGILVLLISLNTFAAGNPNEVKFSNGARLVINFVSGFARELLYYPPNSNNSLKLDIGGNIQRIKLFSERNSNNSPEEIVNAHFGGIAPNFWPVIVTKNSKDKYKSARFYIGENAEILKVAVQSNSASYDSLAFSFPDRWEVHRLNFDEKEYLVLVDERTSFPTGFYYLRLEDGYVATHVDRSLSPYRGFFDETTGLVKEARNDGTFFDFPPKDLGFEPADRTAKHDGIWWFPEPEQARFLLDPIGPFTAVGSKEIPKVQAEDQKPEESNSEENKPEEKKPEEKKEISIKEKHESDLVAKEAEEEDFNAAAAEFASSLKGKPAYEIVGKFRSTRFRFVLGRTGKKTLAVVDTWTNEITDTITLEDEDFVVVNTPQSYTTTIAYPRLHSEVVYTQPDSNNPRLTKIFHRKESAPEFCRGLLSRKGHTEVTK